jgi:hypothetical protein
MSSVVSCDDIDVWKFIDGEDAWIYDKLILSKRLGYYCGPAGVAPEKSGNYIVRPISNYRGMGRGSSIMHLNANEDIIPDGYFWCEVFTGRHLSFDYHRSAQTLAVEGFKDSTRTDRFISWKKTSDVFALPKFLFDIAEKYEWMNIEVIGDKIIEVHLRYNPDFMSHDADEIAVIWKENFVASKEGDRIGFWINQKIKKND